MYICMSDELELVISSTDIITVEDSSECYHNCSLDPLHREEERKDITAPATELI